MPVPKTGVLPITPRAIFWCGWGRGPTPSVRVLLPPGIRVEPRHVSRTLARKSWTFRGCHSRSWSHPSTATKDPMRRHESCHRRLLTREESRIVSLFQAQSRREEPLVPPAGVSRGCHPHLQLEWGLGTVSKASPGVADSLVFPGVAEGRPSLQGRYPGEPMSGFR